MCKGCEIAKRLKNDGSFFRKCLPLYGTILVCGKLVLPHTRKEKFMIKVLLVTNDSVLERMLIVTLTINGLTVVPVGLMSEVTSSLNNDSFNLILVDENFADICPIIRKRGFNVPILVMGDPSLKFEGIDYINKPFEFPHLKVAMNDIFRRKKPPTDTTFTFGNLTIDATKSLVTIKDRMVNLGKMEMAILVSLAKKTGNIVSKEKMRMDLEAQGHFFNTTIFHHIKNLKRKLRDVAGETLQIRSVTGEGYQLLVD
jgi:DNA-binding response OmpR family regulator